MCVDSSLFRSYQFLLGSNFIAAMQQIETLQGDFNMHVLGCSSRFLGMDRRLFLSSSLMAVKNATKWMSRCRKSTGRYLEKPTEQN